MPGNVVSWPGGDGGEELFRVTPVNRIRERRVWEVRNEVLPRRVLPNGPVYCRRRQKCGRWHEFCIQVVQYEVIRYFEDGIHLGSSFTMADMEEADGSWGGMG